MTGHQEGTLKMSLASDMFCTANAAITASLPQFTNHLAVVKTTNARIRALGVVQETDKKGDTTAKKEARAMLIAKAMDVGRRVAAFATNENDSALLALVNYSETDLKRISDQRLVSCSQVIHDSAVKVIGEMDGYNLTPAMLAELLSLITNFNSMIPIVRVDTVDSAEATQELTILFKTLTATWDKLDALVEMVRISDPNFYNEYKNVRRVIVAGTGSLALKIRTTNAETGAPEANVTLTLTPADGQLRGATASSKSDIVKRTAAGGGSNYKGLADGTYTVTARKPGLKDATLTVNVVNGELSVLEIVMEKA